MFWPGTAGVPSFWRLALWLALYVPGSQSAPECVAGRTSFRNFLLSHYCSQVSD
jgi:hypothetical protein